MLTFLSRVHSTLPTKALLCSIATAGALSASIVVPCGAQTTPGVEHTAMPSKGLLWGSKMTIENQPCCKPASGAKASDQAEAAVLAGLADRARRDGTILWLRIQGNRSLKITDCDDQGACEADRFRVHRLVAWWPVLGYYVVNVGLYEENLAYLISERDGRTTWIAARPVLSPAGRMAVALQSNLMAGVNLDVIDMTTDPPKVTGVNTVPACAGAGPNSFLRPRPVWVDDSHVRFEGVSPQPGDNPNTKQLLRIGAGVPQWEC
jgi:hypothetical protein